MNGNLSFYVYLWLKMLRLTYFCVFFFFPIRMRAKALEKNNSYKDNRPIGASSK